MRDDAESRVPRRADRAPVRGNGTTKKPRTNRRSSTLNDACPHLGIVGDRATNFAFPTGGNRCFQPPSPQTIPLHHQETFCLHAKHTACPIFRRSVGAGPSPRSQSPSPWYHVFATRTGKLDRLLLNLKSTRKRGARSLAVAIAALSIVVLISVLFIDRQLLSTMGDTVTAGGARIVPVLAPAATATQPTGAIEKTVAAPSASATLPSPIVVTRSRPTADAGLSAGPATEASSSPGAGSTAAPTATPTATPLPTTLVAPAATSELANCEQPAGWGPYIVSWGETLFRLSLQFNVSVDELRQANCLTSTTVYAGQSLMVPYQQPAGTPTVVPTSAATATPTPSP